MIIKDYLCITTKIEKEQATTEEIISSINPHPQKKKKKNWEARKIK